MSRARDLADLGNNAGGLETLTVSDITDITATADEINLVDGSVSGPLSHRNMVINGAMQLAQRGDEFTSQTGTSYHLDRWETTANNLGNGQYRVDQDTDSPEGFHFSTKLSCTQNELSQDANNQMWFAQHIEGNNVQHLKFFQSNPDTVTFSFWVKSNTTGKYAFQLKLSDNGSTINNVNTRIYATDFEIGNPGDWEYKKLSITLDSSTAETKVTDNTFSMGFLIWLSAGSSRQSTTPETWTNNGNQATNTIEADNFFGSTSNYFNITGVQLELGSVATPFEHRSYGEVADQCYRYYQEFEPTTQQGADTKTAGGNIATFLVPFLKPMRSSPSVSVTGNFQYYNGSSWVSATTSGGAYTNSAYLNLSVGSNGLASGSSSAWHIRSNSQKIILYSELT